jgi:hypothetical protein
MGRIPDTSRSPGSIAEAHEEPACLASPSEKAATAGPHIAEVNRLIASGTVVSQSGLLSTHPGQANETDIVGSRTKRVQDVRVLYTNTPEEHSTNMGSDNLASVSSCFATETMISAELVDGDQTGSVSLELTQMESALDDFRRLKAERVAIQAACSNIQTEVSNWSKYRAGPEWLQRASAPSVSTHFHFVGALP